MLNQLKQQAAKAGAIRGESAKDFAKRNPQGAQQLAQYIAANRADLAKSIAAKVAK